MRFFSQFLPENQQVPTKDLLIILVNIRRTHVRESLLPVVGTETAVEFFNLYSDSPHTGFEELRTTVLMLYMDVTEGSLSLIAVHNIDESVTEGAMQFEIAGLPGGRSSVPHFGLPVVSNRSQIGRRSVTAGPGLACGDGWRAVPVETRIG